MRYLLSHVFDNFCARGAGSVGVLEDTTQSSVTSSPHRHHTDTNQIKPSNFKSVSSECNVDTKCPVLIFPDHKTTTFLINPLFFTRSLHGTPTLYDNYRTLKVRAGHGSVLISDSDGKISISVFSLNFPAKEVANQFYMKDLRSYQRFS